MRFSYLDLTLKTRAEAVAAFCLAGQQAALNGIGGRTADRAAGLPLRPTANL